MQQPSVVLVLLGVLREDSSRCQALPSVPSGQIDTQERFMHLQDSYTEMVAALGRMCPLQLQ